MKTPIHLMIRNLFSRFFAAIMYILSFFSSKQKRIYNQYLSIVAVIKDEGPYIKEWIEYHKLVGVEKFYLYDAATDNTREILEPYILSGIVEYRKFEGKAIQIPAYNDAITKHRFSTRWLAIIDADEFLVPTGKYTSIPEILSQFEQYAALGVNWVEYDSNGHIVKPNGLVIRNFTSIHGKAKSLVIKSIVNPRNVVWCGQPHCCHYATRHGVKPYAVDENGTKIKNSMSTTTSINKIRCNHYFSKSKEEFIKKCNRGMADSASFRIVTEDQYIFSDSVQDLTMIKWADLLDKKMNDEK